MSGHNAECGCAECMGRKLAGAWAPAEPGKAPAVAADDGTVRVVAFEAPPAGTEGMRVYGVVRLEVPVGEVTALLVESDGREVAIYWDSQKRALVSAGVRW